VALIGLQVVEVERLQLVVLEQEIVLLVALVAMVKHLLLQVPL
jgi:hypothetical protein